MGNEYKLIHSTNCTTLTCKIEYSYKINVYQKYDNVKKDSGPYYKLFNFF